MELFLESFEEVAPGGAPAEPVLCPVCTKPIDENSHRALFDEVYICDGCFEKDLAGDDPIDFDCPCVICDCGGLDWRDCVIYGKCNYFPLKEGAKGYYYTEAGLTVRLDGPPPAPEPGGRAVTVEEVNQVIRLPYVGWNPCRWTVFEDHPEGDHAIWANPNGEVLLATFYEDTIDLELIYSSFGEFKNSRRLWEQIFPLPEEVLAALEPFLKPEFYSALFEPSLPLPTSPVWLTARNFVEFVAKSSRLRH